MSVLKNLFIFQLCFLLYWPSLAQTNSILMLTPDFNEQAHITRQLIEPVASVSSKNSQAQSFEILKMAFQKNKDRLYLQSLISHSTPQPQVTAKVIGNTIEITSDRLEKIILSDFNPTNKSMLLNGHFIKWNGAETAEALVSKISNLLHKKQTDKSGFKLHLLIPNAQASFLGVAIEIAFVAGFVILPIWYYMNAAENLTHSLQKIAQECEGRNPRQAFDDSETKKLLLKINSGKMNINSYEKVSSDTNCQEWAQTTFEKVKKQEVRISLKQTQEWCPLLKRANQCLASFQPKVPTAAGNSKESLPAR